MFFPLLFLRKPPFKTGMVGDAKYFNQILDHFDSSNKITFKQRYYVNNTFKNDATPRLIVYIGGEATLRESAVDHGSYMDLAILTNSSVVALEHRYFGESHPFEELTAQNLKFLTSDQALADLAYFIETYIHDNYHGKRPTVLVVGGSYPGTLSSYFRLKYPHIANFSWASSPPLLVKNNFTEYDKHCAEVLKSRSMQCYINTKKIFDDLNNDPSRIKQYVHFKKSTNEVSHLSILSDFIAGIIQYDNIYNLVKGFCDKQNGDEPDFDAFFYYFDKYLDGADPDSFDDFLNTNLSIHSGYADSISWTWMTCNEFGWYQTASGELRPSKVDLDYSEALCYKLFQRGLAQNTQDKFNQYNAKYPKSTMIFFTNGMTDPWSELSVADNINNSRLGRHSVKIDGASHCSDLHSESKNDSEDLKRKRQQVIDTMKRWMKNSTETCKNGVYILDSCVCNEGYTGNKCDIQNPNAQLFKVFTALVVLLPTLMMIIIGCSAWCLFKKDGEDTEIKTIP